MDDLDRQILAVLVADGRMSFADLGEAVNLSASAAKRRVDRMRADGTILGFSAVVHPAPMGWRTEAFIEVFGDGDTSLPALRSSLTALPEVVGAYTVAGDADALLRVRCADPAHLEDTLERLRANGNIARTRTQLVLTVLVERALPPPD